MYLIEIPHQRPAYGYSCYETEIEWARDAENAADVRGIETPTVDANNEELIEWARHDLAGVEVLETIDDVRKLRERCMRDKLHQCARIAVICDEWIEASDLLAECKRVGPSEVIPDGEIPPTTDPRF